MLVSVVCINEFVLLITYKLLLLINYKFITNRFVLFIIFIVVLYIYRSRGKNLTTSDGAFREAFGKLSTLRSFCKQGEILTDIYIVYIILCIKGTGCMLLWMCPHRASWKVYHDGNGTHNLWSMTILILVIQLVEHWTSNPQDFREEFECPWKCFVVFKL